MRLKSKMFKARTCIAMVGLIALVSCGKSKSTTPAATDAASTAAAAAATNVVSTTSLSQVNFSTVLKVSLPKSVKASGTAAALDLTSAKKSFEACQMRSEIRTSLSQLAQAAQTICMIQQISSLKFGTKYNIDMSKLSAGGGGGGTPTPPAGGTPTPPAGGTPTPPAGGPSSLLADTATTPTMPTSMQVWVDNAVAGTLKVYFCNNRKLAQMFTVSDVDVTNKTSKGSVIMDMSMSMGSSTSTFKRSVLFDGVTVAGRMAMTIKEVVDASGVFSGRHMLAMSLSDTGISTVVDTSTGTAPMSSSTGGSPLLGSTSDNNFSGAGVYSPDFGSIISEGTVFGTTFSTKAYFDGAGNIVEPSTQPTLFGSGGTLYLDDTYVPAALASTFEPDTFPSDAWDCSGTTDLDTSSMTSTDTTAMSACNTTWNEIPEKSCMDPTNFGQGSAATISDSARPDPTKVQTLPPPPPNGPPPPPISTDTASSTGS